MTHPWSRGRGTLEEATKIQTSPPSTISRQTKAPEYVLRMSGPAGRVTRGAGKDTAGFGGGGTAPPADMLPLLRLRAPPPPPPPPASRRRLPGLAAAAAAAADPIRGVQACCSRKGCGHGPSADRGPPRHVGTGERASALATVRVTSTGVVRPSLSASSAALLDLQITCPPFLAFFPTSSLSLSFRWTNCPLEHT